MEVSLNDGQGIVRGATRNLISLYDYFFI